MSPEPAPDLIRGEGSRTLAAPRSVVATLIGMTNSALIREVRGWDGRCVIPSRRRGISAQAKVRSFVAALVWSTCVNCGAGLSTPLSIGERAAGRNRRATEPVGKGGGQPVFDRMLPDD